MGAIRRIVVAVLLGLFLTAGSNLAAPAPAQAAQYAAVCGARTWTGKDPSTCRNDYRVYRITANRPRLIFSTDNARPVSWHDIRRGYAAAQTWCSNNSLTCTVVTTVGVTVVSGWLAPARS